MDINTATTAAGLASQINALTSLIAMLETAISEHWPITSMRATAPVTGSVYPAGTPIDLLAGNGGLASDANSQMGLQQALATYQAALDALNTQLAGL